MKIKIFSLISFMLVLILVSCTSSASISADTAASTATSATSASSKSEDHSFDLIIIGDSEPDLLNTLSTQSTITNYLIIDNHSERAVSILFDEKHAVRAVNTEADSTMKQYECRAVILATGPYSDNNKSLLLPFLRNQNNQMITDDNGQISFTVSDDAVPTKCGVPLKTDQETEPGISRSSASNSAVDSNSALPVIKGLYVLGSAGDKTISQKLIDRVLHHLETELSN